jgi:PAS domain S-box-containing protein
MVLTWRLVRTREQLVDRMTRFIEGVPVGIFKTDSDWRVTEVNEAAVRLLGYPDRAALLGTTAGDLLSQPTPNAGAMAGAIEERGAKIGELELRRLDGSSVWVRYHVRAELGTDGSIVAYEGALEDVSSDRTAREATARLSAWKQERSDILDALRRLQPGRTIEQTADSICTEIGRGGELSYAAVLELHNGRGATVIAARSGHRRIAGTRVAQRFAAELRRHAQDGPWVEDILSRRTEPGYRRLASTGLRQLALVPIEVGDEVVALLLAGTACEELDLRERLHTLGEFSAHAAALIGPALRTRYQREAARDRIQDIIDRAAFVPVFQPIVDLRSGAVLGYEALTRFQDGTPPDVIFAEATTCGMSIPLEMATIAAALEASSPLPANRFIDLNVSPELVLAEEPLRSRLRERGFNIVLEITEHMPIDDYAALRASFASLGDNVQVAVDDAGAGYASLRHITELRPQFVKLDRALIAGIDSDLIRQALITGMVHFTDGVASMLIAEGVETEAEREVLLTLGVRAAQGYLFARPQSAELVPK